MPAGCSEVLTLVLAEFYEPGEHPGGDVQETNISVWREGRDCSLDLRADSQNQEVNKILERASA